MTYYFVVIPPETAYNGINSKMRCWEWLIEGYLSDSKRIGVIHPQAPVGRLAVPPRLFYYFL